MKNKIKEMLILSVFSTVVAFLFVTLVYRVFTQYLFYEIYNVGESNASATEDKEIEAGAQYDEYFVPQSDYLKSISININQVATFDLNDEDETYHITGLLKDDTGEVVRKARYTVKTSDVREQIYCKFPFETWVEPGRQYQLSILFPENQRVSVTFGGETGHSAEHVVLMAEGQEIADGMYMQFIYGTYSKKILLLWFMAFWVIAYGIGQGLKFMRKKPI